MLFFEGLFSNACFLSAAIAWFTAQVLKTLIHLFVTKKFVAERLVGTGGMPSSHSATVCGLATAVAINSGSESIEFAIALILAIVVMYDALGVRRETGKQAIVINEMMQMFNNMGKEMTVEERLKEFVGHTPLQVIAGAILGIVVAFSVCAVI